MFLRLKNSIEDILQHSEVYFTTVDENSFLKKSLEPIFGLFLPFCGQGEWSRRFPLALKTSKFWINAITKSNWYGGFIQRVKLQKTFYDLVSFQCFLGLLSYSETGFKFFLHPRGQTRKWSTLRANPSQAISPRKALGKKSSATSEALKGAFIVRDYHILTHIPYQLARIPSILILYYSDAW